MNFRTKDGEQRVDFFDCEVWKGWAENLVKTAKKGSLVMVTGRLSQEKWLDKKTKSKRSRVKIMAQTALHVEAKYAGKQAEREPGEDNVPY